MDKDILRQFGASVKFDYSLAHLTWLKVGGNAEVFYRPNSLEELCKFLQCLPKGVSINFIGAGSNLLIRDGGIDGVVIKLGGGFNYIKLDEGFLTVGAATLNYSLATFCQQNAIQGFEFLIGIPGNIGGGMAMNAGAYGKEFKDVVHSIVAISINNGNVLQIPAADIGFLYRGNSLPADLLFLEAKLNYQYGAKDEIERKMQEISQQRNSTQPVKEKTCGSIFANPAGYKSWQLLDKVGMRGYNLNGAKISDLHCNFFINTGNATAKDLELLGELARSKVLQAFGIDLCWEVKKIGNAKSDF